MVYEICETDDFLQVYNLFLKLSFSSIKLVQYPPPHPTKKNEKKKRKSKREGILIWVFCEILGKAEFSLS